MDHHPAKIILVTILVLPDDRGDFLRRPAQCGIEAATNVGVIAYRPAVRVMQACDGQADNRGAPHRARLERLEQNDEATGVLGFVGSDTDKCHFASEGIERVARREDRPVDSQHVELVAIGSAGVLHAHDGRRKRIGRGQRPAGRLPLLLRQRRVDEGVVGVGWNLERLSRRHPPKGVSRHVPIPSKEKSPP